ncbi:paired domain-containing protein [Trichonephila clavipes]|nr:paired domain-containing protein [Trichonephila clavipes]
MGYARETNCSPFALTKFHFTTEESSPRNLEPFEPTTHLSSHSKYGKSLCSVPGCQSFNFDLCVFDNVEQKVYYFRVVSARKTTVRLLNVPLQTVSDAIYRFKDLGNDGRHPGSGRKRTVSTSRNRKAIEKRVQRNPRVSMRQIARDMRISDRSVRRIAKTDLGLKPYKLQKKFSFSLKKTRTASKMPKTFEMGRKSALGEITFH